MDNNFWKVNETDDVVAKSFKGIANTLVRTLLEIIIYWYLYLPAFILAGFSGFAMWFVTGGRVESGASGWMVTQQGNILYVIIGVIFSEPYCVNWFVKLETYEGNGQRYAAFLGLLASLATSILTGWSAAEIIAKMTSSEIFTVYQKTLDIWTQNYIVHLAPVAAFTHMLLAGWYRAVSGEAAARRDIRRAQLDLRKTTAKFEAAVAQTRTATAQADLIRVQEEVGAKLGHDDARQTQKKYAGQTQAQTPSQISDKSKPKKQPAESYEDVYVKSSQSGIEIRKVETEDPELDPTPAEQ